MQIALIGYGKMGKAIQAQAQNMGLKISQVIDQDTDLSSATFNNDEIAIEFTAPDACVQNIQTLLSKNVPVICGTTGWYDQKDFVKTMVGKHNGSFLYASNFSIGVHLFWKSLAHLSKQMDAFGNYCAHAKEVHHIHKKDIPSGTAQTCSDIVCQSVKRFRNLEIKSIREGEVFGDHHVYFESVIDTIELSHKAKSRDGFAQGALECAQWIKDKKGFFTIDDFLAEKLS